MTKPSNFILNTDYATLKNDADGYVSVALPSSLNIAAATTYSTSSSITLGVAGSDIRQRISTSKDNIWYTSRSILYASSSGATVSGSPSSYDVVVTVSRTAPTTITLTVFIPNPYGSTMTITGLSQVISAYVATFIPPMP